MAGVLDGGSGVEGFLVDVAGLQYVHHIAEVAAEARPGALGVVDGAGGGEDVACFVYVSFCGGAEVDEGDGEWSVAVFGTGVGEGDICIVGAGFLGIPPGDDADWLGSVAGAFHSAECAEATGSNDAASSVESEEDFLMPGGEALVEEAIDEDEGVWAFEGCGGDVALLRRRAEVGLGGDIGWACGTEEDFHLAARARGPGWE
jgi:hypothetical protein